MVESSLYSQMKCCICNKEGNVMTTDLKSKDMAVWCWEHLLMGLEGNQAVLKGRGKS